MYRMANFFISKSLDKAEKMPNHRKWKVSEADKCVEGPILLYIRAKGWFFDRVCQPAIRHCVLTKRGFLLIYMRDEKGFVLDVRSAFEIKSVSDNVSVMRTKYRRCRIKIRYTFGTVNIILTNGKIDLWRDHLLNATNAPQTGAITKRFALPRPDPDYAVATTPLCRASTPYPSMYGPLDNVEISPSLVALKSFSSPNSDIQVSTKTPNWAKVKEPSREPSETSVLTAVDISTCDDDFQWMSSGLSPIDEESHVAETSMSGLFNHNSIRESTIPVGWLRRQLEHKLDADRRRTIAVAPPTVPEASTMTTPTEEELMPILARSVELPQLPLAQTAVHKAVKSKRHVKFSKKGSSPVKASAKSVPSDSSSCENTRFNSFQFWRSSMFESDV
ncbi:hypothetical protein PENTCL1PPCAC_22074 [Pristionchus entomophagus]|uniref:DUF7778 domain-containing protein n=1 Tax=Pristionchus entomophagus TaxID=358040 RepID=A0AAV5TZE8_9BILA|nr:hypothetical protein PENTCL1PPCAC_22074 [Pristionchus entomophagus]